MGRILRRIALGIGLLGILLGMVAAVLLWPKYEEYRALAGKFDLGELDRIPAISEVFDQFGGSYGRLPGEVRYVVPLARISPNFVNAVLAREDSRFYDHHGVDFNGIARAAVRNLLAGGVKEGASTLTQQLARNTFDLGEDRWRRKGVEALLALRIERQLTKAQIFEDYANRIYYGLGMYGVETAARACFGKSAKDLTLSEAAILAGLIRSPNRLNPLEDSRTALAQRDQVLARMEELKMITSAQARAARAEPMPSGKRQPPHVQENYAMDAVGRDLAILLPREIVEQGGLKIFTTIDRRLQLLAENAVESSLAAAESEKGWPHPTRAATPPVGKDGAKATESPYVQGALVAIDNETGGIRAIVGGRDFKSSPYNRAILSKRPIGSTFKPFVYAAAYEHGLMPGTLIDDAPLRDGEVAGLVGAWDPENSDGENLGLQPVETGLIRSRNTMTIRVGERATRGAVRALALKAGLESVPDMPSIYLGAFGVTLKSLTAAYTMFPNDGVRRQPYIIDHIEDRHGRVIYKATRAELRCLSPAVDYVVNGLLRDVIAKGTAASAASLGLDFPAAGKTGTTDDYKDAWFVGYTTRLTCGVWVGMDRPERIEAHGYGAKLALPIWGEYMKQAASWKYVATDFPAPEGLVEADVCSVSGALATDACRDAGTVHHVRLPRGMVPTAPCTAHAGALVAESGNSAFPPPEPTASAPPVAVAIPVEAPAANATPAPQVQRGASGNYRVIQTPNGIQVLYDR